MDPKKKAKYNYDLMLQPPPPPSETITMTMTNSIQEAECNIEANQEEQEGKDNMEEPDLNEEYDDVSHDQDLQLKLNNRIHYLHVKNEIIQNPLAYTTKIYDVLFAFFQNLNSNNDIVKFSWEKPFTNDIVSGSVPGYINTLVTDTPDTNLNTRNNYYKEALRDDLEIYYLIKNKNNEKRGDIIKDIENIASIIEIYFQNYFKKIGIVIPNNIIVVEKIKHGNDFKTKHENILFENYSTYNIYISNGNIKDMMNPDNLDEKIQGFLNHIKSNDNLVLFSFVTCEVDETLYNTIIKPTFITKDLNLSNKLTDLFFNCNALATFLPLQKFLPRNILPVLIARENALKYTFENQPVLIGRGIPNDGEIKNKTLQHCMVDLFLTIKDHIYKYYSDSFGNPDLNLNDYKKCEYKNNMKIIKERIFEMIKWGAKNSNASIVVTSNNEQNNTDPSIKIPVENENDTGGVITGDDIQANETQRTPIYSIGSTYHFKDCFDMFNDHVLSINPDLNNYDKIIGKLPSLRQLGRLLSTVFCLYLVLYDKGYVSITGGDLFRYLLYDIINTSADFDFGIFINDDVDKNEILKKLISSVFMLNIFLYDSYYFYKLKYKFEFDMFYLPKERETPTPKKFYIQINCRDRFSNRYYNPFTMRTINNPLKFPVSMVSADLVLQEEISDDDRGEFSNVGKYIISWLDCVVKTFDKIDPQLHSVLPDTNIDRLKPELLDIRYLIDPTTKQPVKTTEHGFYYSLKPTIHTDVNELSINDLINDTNQKLVNGTPLQKYYETIINGLFHLNELDPNDVLFKILLTPIFNPNGMYIFVDEVTRQPFLEGRIVAGKNDKDQLRLENISNRLNNKIADLSNDVVVKNLDAIYENNFNEEELSLSSGSDINSENNSQNNSSNLVSIFTTLREILEMIIFKNNQQPYGAKLTEKINHLSDLIFNQKTIEENDEDAAYVEKATESDLESIQSSQLTQLSETTTPSMLQRELEENPDIQFQGEPFHLVNTKNRSQQKHDPDNVTNTLGQFITTSVDKIYDETVNDNNGRSKTSYIITKLKPIVMDESAEDGLPDLEPVVGNEKMETGGKRSRKRRRDKKKTRKAIHKKGKSKKRASRVNKKRIRRLKTRKNA